MKPINTGSRLWSNVDDNLSLFQAFRSWGPRKEMWAGKKTTRGWGRGESENPPFPLSLFSSLFFSRSLPSHRTPLSERLEQATIIYNYQSSQSSGSSRIFLKQLSAAIGTIIWKPGVITAVCNVPLLGYAYAYSWNLENMYRIFFYRDKYFTLYWCFRVRISFIL